MQEPLWKTVLCWGAVFAFFTVPITALGIIIFFPVIREHLENYKFVGAFFQSVTALVFGLSGLRSLDRYVETKNGNRKEKQPEK
jgi:hypothetical protein